MRHYMLALFLTLSVAVSAQEDTKDKDSERMNGFQGRIDSEKPLEVSPPLLSEKKDSPLYADTVNCKIEAKSFPDISNYYFECYAKVVNKYGFWKGVGPKLSKDDIRHMRRYVKLLRPKGQPSSAPFTHMQVLDPFGDFDNNSYGPILANPFGNDEGISYLWKWKLKNLCQFEKIFRNGEVIQENMYDENGKLILQYYPTSVSKNQIVGHYTDAYGVLAKLRDDADCTYLGITLDDNGYESQIAFMDKDGQLKRNGDDAFIQLITHDAYGNVLKVMSADAVGNPIIDNCGNCGWQYTYDKNGNYTTATCINQFGQPQPMSKKRDSDTEDCIRIRYTYDKWGNKLTKTFYDEDWKPDTITGGIHRYVYTNTLYGNTTSMRAEGLGGSLVSGQAKWRWKFDNDGHCLYYIVQDADGHYWSSGTCLKKAKYEKGQSLWKEEYTSPNGVDTVLTYRYVRTPDCDSIFYYDDGYINIERYDDKRRIVSDEYYDLAMIPTMHYNYHKITTNYIERPDTSSIIEKRYLDKSNQPIKIEGDYWRKYNVEIFTHDYIHRTYSDFEYEGQQLVGMTEVDSVKRQRVITSFKDGYIVEKYAHDLSEDCAKMVGLLCYDSLGYRGRTFKSNALYYNARKYSNIQGNTVAWKGLNEFGEPSYILNGDWDNATLFCTNVMGDSYYYDENGDTIPRYSKNKKAFKFFKDSLYKSFCIELIDSIGLKLGLRTGDLIVRYGDWHYPVPSQSGRYRELLLCLESVKTACREKTMVVMRHDGATKTSKLVELAMPVGTPKQLGFIYHMLYMTEKEKSRYDEVVRRNRQEVHIDSINTVIDENKKVHFFMPYKIGDNSDKELFCKGFQENVIVIAWEPHVGGKSYLLTCQHDLFNHFWGHEMDSVTIHYTVDGKNILSRVFTKKEADEGGRASNTKVDDVSYIYALADSLQREFDKKYPVDKVALKPHDAAEQLLQLPGTNISQDDGSGFRGEGDYEYGNVNAFYKVSIDYDELSFDDMFLAYNIIKNVDYHDYCYMHNERDHGYFLESKGRFSECSWTTNDGIVFLSDSVDFYGKMVIVAEVVDSGFFRQQGLYGKYALLKCNGWTLGRTKVELEDVIKKEGQRIFVLAKLEGEEGNYKLGRKVKLKVPEGNLDIKLNWVSVSDETWNDAYLFSKHLKR